MAAESPLIIIIEMIGVVISNTIRTMWSLFQLFLNLLGSLGFVSVAGGFAGFALSVIIIGLVVFFLGRFVFNAGKGLIILILVGLILVWVFILSLV